MGNSFEPAWFSTAYGIACAVVLLGALVALVAAIARRPVFARRLARASIWTGVASVVLGVLVLIVGLPDALASASKATKLARLISGTMNSGAMMLPAFFIAGAALRFSTRARR